MKSLIVFLLPLIACSSSICAQEKKGEESEKGTQQLSLMLSHSHISNGIDEDGNRTWIAMPSWGFDYFYWVSNTWSVGLSTDVILDNFKVQNKEGNGEIERSFPFAAVPSVKFKPFAHSSFALGMGGEFASEGNYALTRITYELGWEIPHGWEISGSLAYDIKWNGYDTWTLGVVISRMIRNE